MAYALTLVCQDPKLPSGGLAMKQRFASHGPEGVKAIDSWKWLVIDLNVLPQQEIVDRFRNCLDLTNKALRVSMTDPPYDDFRLNFDLAVLSHAEIRSLVSEAARTNLHSFGRLYNLPA
jgi:hypothetical protein